MKRKVKFQLQVIHQWIYQLDWNLYVYAEWRTRISFEQEGESTSKRRANRM